jgi:hypothetical protein
MQQDQQVHRQKYPLKITGSRVRTFTHETAGSLYPAFARFLHLLAMKQNRPSYNPKNTAGPSMT